LHANTIDLAAMATGAHADALATLCQLLCEGM
jgi:hypothetical protein